MVSTRNACDFSSLTLWWGWRHLLGMADWAMSSVRGSALVRPEAHGGKAVAWWLLDCPCPVPCLPHRCHLTMLLNLTKICENDLFPRLVWNTQLSSRRCYRMVSCMRPWWGVRWPSPLTFTLQVCTTSFPCLSFCFIIVTNNASACSHEIRCVRVDLWHLAILSLAFLSPRV